jgi:hypothetical protein
MPDDTAVLERDDAQTLPAPTAGPDLPELADPLSMMRLPVSLQIFFNDQLFRRCQTVANYLAKAEGYAPRHLIGKPEACFAVVSRSLTWRLDPYAVAQACYQTPNGQVGYYGSLCQAIIENSGRLDPSFGGVKFEHQGDWTKLRGKWKRATGQRGGEYAVPDWEQWGAIEQDLGVIVRAKMLGEDNPREMPFDLVQAYPRNSTLWATDPRTQICYTAVRRFASSTVPTLFMGVPFDHEDMSDWISGLRDVTPGRPELEEFGPEKTASPRRPAARGKAAGATAQDPKPGNGAAAPTTAAEKWFFNDEVGEVFEFDNVDEAVTTYAQRLEAAKGNRKLLEATWDNGARLLAALRERGHTDAADALNNEHGQLLGEIEAAERAAEAAAAGAGQPDPSTQQEQGQPQLAQQPEDKGDNRFYRQADFDVLVPLPDGMPMNQWHMAARDRLKAMHEATRPGADFVRFQEINAGALTRLKGELRSWYNMLEKEITRGAGAPA